jgi:hypothetical protein
MAVRRHRPVGEREQQLLAAGRTRSTQGTAVSRAVEDLQQRAGNQAVVQLLQQKGKGAAGKLDLDDEKGIPVESVDWKTEAKLVESYVGDARLSEVEQVAATSTPVGLTRVPDEHSAKLAAGSTFASGALHLANKGGSGTLAMRKVMVSEQSFGAGIEKVGLVYDRSKVEAHGTPMRASKGTLQASGIKVGVMSWKLDGEGLTAVLRNGGDAGKFEDAMANQFRFMDVYVVPKGKGGPSAVTLPRDSYVTRVQLVSERGVPSFEVKFVSPSWTRSHKKDVVAVPGR